MLTALGEEDDRLAGLSLGADDYVTKPFSPRELALRVGSVLRRSRPDAQPLSGTGVLTDGDLVVDTQARSARLAGDELRLTVREFDLLAYLISHPGQVFTRADLLEQVWGWSFGDYSTVTVHVKRVRSKLDEGSASGRITTVYGVGYRYDPGGAS
jgi:DNA-binding response OmpR family regulator